MLFLILSSGKRSGFDFEIARFPFLDGDVPRSASCGAMSLCSSGLLGCVAVLRASTLAVDC